MKKYLVLCMVLLASACSSFKAERVTLEKGDEEAMSVTDNWLTTDTKNAVKTILETMDKNRSLKQYLASFKGTPKLFVGEIKNGTKDAYFPIGDLMDEFLTELSMTGDYVLIDKEQRDAILKEITFQNDGMVNVKEAKQIGRMSGADLIIFGDVRENSNTLDGKTVKEYSVNVRMTDIEKGYEVLRARFVSSKTSKRSSFGW